MLVNCVVEDVIDQYGIRIQVYCFHSFYFIYATVIGFLIWSHTLPFSFLWL